MDRKNLLLKISNYSPEDIQEKVFRADFLHFIYANEDCFKRSLLKGHITGSSWIVNEDRTKALLTHHQKLDKWLQLGGHADGDSEIIRVATKEAKEESGLASIELISEEIFDLDIHTIPEFKDVPEHLHFDVRFLFFADESEVLIKNKESKELKWIPLEELAYLTDNNPSILRMADKTKLLVT